MGYPLLLQIQETARLKRIRDPACRFWRNVLGWEFASGKTVEDPPIGDILAEVFEMMLRSCGDEEEITSLE
jgi:hypothetical protein